MARSLAALCALSVSLFGQADPKTEAVAPPLPLLVLSGTNNHDCEWTAPELARLFEETGRFVVDVSNDPPAVLADRERLARYDAIVLDYNGPRWGEAAETHFLEVVKAGTGVVVVHAANNAFPGWEEYEKLVMYCWRQGTGHGRFHAFDVEITDAHHPVTQGMDPLVAHPDELYHRLVHMHGAPSRLLLDALSTEQSGGTGAREPMAMVRTYGEGRVFHTPLGHVWRKQEHTKASFRDPQFRWFLARGAEWAATGAVTLSPLPPVAPNTLSAAERAAGFQLLFDGATTKGWRGFRSEAFPSQGWQVEGGCLVHTKGGGGGDIVTDEQYADFELRFEWAVAAKANSGVIYRCTEAERATGGTGPDDQVLDDAGASPSAMHSAASLYALAAPKGKVVRPTGAFNSGRIVVDGGRVQHWLNGVKVVDCALQGEPWEARVQASKFKTMPGFGRAPEGHIGLQDHGDEVRYRSLRLRRL